MAAKKHGLRKLKIGTVLAVCLVIGLILFDVGSFMQRRELYHITVLMANYNRVDRILVSQISYEYEFRDGDEGFDEIRQFFYPFQPGRIRIHPSSRRALQARSSSRLFEIEYSVGDDILFVVGVYTFEMFPFEYEASYTNGHTLATNVFTVGSMYGLAFVNDGNFVASFTSFESFDDCIFSPFTKR